MLKLVAALIAVCLLALPSVAATAVERSSRISPIPDDLWRSMQGVSWHDDVPGCGRGRCKCPRRGELVLLSIPYVDFEGKEKTGRMVVHRDVAAEVLAIFEDLHRQKYPINSIRLIDDFHGDDDASMAANNTSAFNCRLVPGSAALSMHSQGRAVDINPVQNPFIWRGTVRPPSGASFDGKAERIKRKPGVITAGDGVTTAFSKRGWKWGGDWFSMKDYQHFFRGVR
ncbi:M15 family metallopeptidase [Rhizobium laguerreae]|uniref:M15 family metallopeptidase n=1 Tax=Rhizobium laguerreae TaxID=1076926 RepID=UPI001C9141D6|nr:M15 family metallopeptidase [Rhizobium laguerreae]MBY3151139.1 M15 family metallopeptidase [Rhizobium laguerreae]